MKEKNESIKNFNAIFGDCKGDSFNNIKDIMHAVNSTRSSFVHTLGLAWKIVAEKGWEKAIEELDQYSLETWLRFIYNFQY